MHDNRVIAEGRVDRFVRDILTPSLYRDRTPLEVAVWDDLEGVDEFQSGQSRDLLQCLPNG